MSLLQFWKIDKPNENTFIDEFQKGISLCSNNSDHFFELFKQIYTNIFNENIKKNFTSPKICVIGTQSSGKSSLLENFLKFPIFPKRNQGVGTKSPIKLTLNSNDSKEHLFKVNGQQVNGDDIISNVNKIFDDLGDNYDKKPIEIDISNSSLIDSFEFYDLPGIVAYPEDKKIFTENLAEEYIKDNNIILCVIPITITDLSSYYPISLIKKHKKEKNTIVVFTMADKVHHEDIGEQIISRILNESSEIKINDYLGVNIVINRSDKSNTSLEIQDTNSQKWFQKNILDIIPDEHPQKINISNKLGIYKLIDNLNNYYKEFINKNWIPCTQNKIQLKINNLLELNKELGPNFYNKHETNFFDFTKYKITITTQLLELYYNTIFENIKSIKYEQYYDFDKYYNSLIILLKSMKPLDCRKITLNDINTLIPVLKNRQFKFWRLSRLNNLFSEYISEMFIKKLLYYIETNKSNILAALIQSKTRLYQETFDRNILINYLDFVKIEIIYSKNFFCEELEKLNTPDNMCENITILEHRINIIKEILNLSKSLNKLESLKYSNYLTESNKVLETVELLKNMNYNLEIQQTINSQEYKNEDEIIAKKYINPLILTI